MPPNPTSQDVNMQFIRFLFTNSVEEEVAYRWASRLFRLIGPKALQLRPGTTLREIPHWAVIAEVDSIDFAVVFEPELRMEFAEFLDSSDHSTFREMVQHYARRFNS
jgi:hypothetical protein